MNILFMEALRRKCRIQELSCWVADPWTITDSLGRNSINRSRELIYFSFRWNMEGKLEPHIRWMLTISCEISYQIPKTERNWTSFNGISGKEFEVVQESNRIWDADVFASFHWNFSFWLHWRFLAYLPEFGAITVFGCRVLNRVS